jgi:large subunit ribosomal protein L25
LELIDLNATIRETTGNGPARRLRAAGKLPAILYGPDTDPIKLAVTTTDLEKIFKTANIGQALFSLKIANGQTQTKMAMVKELQQQPVSGALLHIDFYEIAMDRKITVSVPIIPVGKSVGVEMGGILQVIRREIDVLCLPNEIPETIEVDVTDLDVGDSLHVEEIPVEGNIEIPADVNFTVITVLSPKIEEEEEVEEELEGEEGEEVEGAAEDEEAAPADEE